MLFPLFSASRPPPNKKRARAAQFPSFFFLILLHPSPHHTVLRGRQLRRGEDAPAAASWAPPPEKNTNNCGRPFWASCRAERHGHARRRACADTSALWNPAGTGSRGRRGKERGVWSVWAAFFSPRRPPKEFSFSFVFLGQFGGWGTGGVCGAVCAGSGLGRGGDEGRVRLRAGWGACNREKSEGVWASSCGTEVSIITRTRKVGNNRQAS